MSSTNFSSGTVIASTWLNDVNNAVYNGSFPTQVSSAGISYNQGGTGAVTTTVQAKLRQYVSVSDFGAVGDGTTDDTVAIQSAITAVNSFGGGTLLFGAGKTYLISTLVPKEKVFIDLNGSTLFEKSGGSGPIFFDGRTSGAFYVGFGVTNGTLNLNGQNNQNNNQTGSGIWLTNWKQLNFTNLYITGANRVVFNFYGCQNVNISNILCVNNGISTSSQYAYLGYFAKSSDLQRCSCINIDNFKVSTLYGYGFHFFEATNFSLNNATFDNVTQTGTAIAITLTQAQFGTLSNIYANNVDGDAIEVNSSEDIVIQNISVAAPGNRGLLFGDNLTGLYSQRVYVNNFKISSTGGTYSAALNFVRNCVFNNLNTDKTITTFYSGGAIYDHENVISNSIINGNLNPDLDYFQKFSLEKISFTNFYVNSYNGNVAFVSNPKSGTNSQNYSLPLAIGGVTYINFAALNNFGLDGVVFGKLKVNSSLNSSQASYQECLFIASSNLTDLNISSITTVSTAIPRAVTITTDAANGRIVLTNSTGVALNINWTIDLSGSSS